MARPCIRVAILLLVPVLNVAAQDPVTVSRPPQRVTVDIQLYLPGGGTPMQPIAILLCSDDGRINETVFTKPGGLASASGLAEGARVTLAVPAEEGVYQSTTFQFTVADGRVGCSSQTPPGAGGFFGVGERIAQARSEGAQALRVGSEGCERPACGRSGG